MMQRNVETFIGCDKEYCDADIVLFGAPFDSTTSYRPGSRFASKAIRSESYSIETYSPYQDKDLMDINVFDYGDLELPFGSTEKTLELIQGLVTKLMADEKIPFMIGGEHLVSLGAFRAVKEKYNDFHVIHFDAHTDLREDYLGEKLSHATVMRRCWELIGDDRIHQFGIRSGEREEFIWAKEHTNLVKFGFDDLEEIVLNLVGKPVYVTIDLDIMDPSIFPGTGTPEAGGVMFQALLDACLKLKRLNIVGIDMNELAPSIDQSGVSTSVACKLLRELLLMLKG